MVSPDNTPSSRPRQGVHCLLLIVVAGLLCFVQGCGNAHDDVKKADLWRFAIEEPVGSVQDAYAQEFKKRIEDKTKGRIKVRVYPYGTLGTSDQTTELVAMGAVDIATASPGHLGKLIPEVQALLLHFIFTDDEAVNRVALNDPALLALLSSLYEEKRFRLLSIFSEGWMAWTTKRPVQTLEDFKGLKMRVMTSPLLLAAYEAYGAAPTPLPYGEVYGALQLNMIDAQVNPLFAIEEMSFYEVTSNLIFAHQAPFVTTLTTSTAFYQQLSEDDRALLTATVAELVPYIDELQRRYNNERLEKIRKKKPSLKISDFPPDQVARLRDAAQVVRQRFLDLAPRKGAEVLATLQDAVARAAHVAQSDHQKPE